MGEITFWKLNKKRTIIIFAILAVTSYSLVLKNSIQHGRNFQIVIPSILFAAGFLVFILPSINGFRVIKNLINDNNENSLLPLFDSGFTIGVQNKNTWLIFATPCINATISGLPVKFYYTPSDRSSWAELVCICSPLMRENSKCIGSDVISFKLYLRKRLTRNVKPEILKMVSNLKAKGFSSGVGRKVSTKHFDAYE